MSYYVRHPPIRERNLQLNLALYADTYFLVSHSATNYSTGYNYTSYDARQDNCKEYYITHTSTVALHVALWQDSAYGYHKAKHEQCL